MYPLILAFLLTLNPTNSCPSYDEVRVKVQKSRLQEAETALRCRIQENPRDFDSLRLLSDVLWWTGNAEESRALLEPMQAQEDKEFLYYRHDRLSLYRLTLRWEPVLDHRNNLSHESFVESLVHYHAKNSIRVSYEHLSRSFSSHLTEKDDRFTLGHIWNPLPPFYLDLSGSYSPNANFSPEFRLRAEPHWVLPGENDLGLSFQWAKYSGSNSLSLYPSWLKPLNDFLAFTLGTTVLLKPERALSGSLTLHISAHHRWKIKSQISGGKTDEGEGVLDNFISTGFDMGFRLLPPVELRAGLTIYRADLRDEYRSRLEAQCSF